MSSGDGRQFDTTIATLDGSIPLIDVRLLLSTDAGTRAEITRAIRQACCETGFFCLQNAFVNPATYRNVQRHMQRFFALSDADPRKQAVRVADTPGSCGWTPMFGELPYQPGTVAHVESFDCGSEETLNVWPALTDFRDDVCLYRATLTPVAEVVLEALAEAAGIDRRFFADRCSTQELNKLRLLHYPEFDAPQCARNVGISAHTDFECITFISQTAPGLELSDVNGDWHDAPDDDGRIIVLLGDMLERWTNGRYKATGHRVRNTAWSRYSTVIFFAVNDDEIIEPLAEFLGERCPAQYAAVTQRKHIDRQLLQAAKNREI